MKQQINELPPRQPSSAEIQKKRSAGALRDSVLRDEAVGLFNDTLRSASPSPLQPLTDHDRRVRSHLETLLNGSTPQRLLKQEIARDDQIRAEREAIAIADRELFRQQQDAIEREAEQWVCENEIPWRALCRKIVLAAVCLESLENRARNMLAPMPEYHGRSLAMATTIGSGLSLLGYGDPLLDLRTAALNEGIVTRSEIEKAKNG